MQLAIKHWTRILRRWPVDRVRPENVSFQKIMTQRLDKYRAQPSASAAASSIKSNQATVSAVEPRKWDEQAELEQANALYSLLENRYAIQFALPGRLRAPASNTTYYDDLITEMEEAPNRSWFGGIMQRVKGSLRFS